MDTGNYSKNTDFNNGFGDLSFDYFENEAEKVQHESAIEVLSEQFPEREAQVRTLYMQKLAELMPEATIRTFVSIFVIREIKETLNRNKRGLH